jgi:hypothetical protein
MHSERSTFISSAKLLKAFCIPAGHGNSACITGIKFFFNGQTEDPTAAHRRWTGRGSCPATDGLSLNAYTGADRGGVRRQWRTAQAGMEHLVGLTKFDEMTAEQ